MATSKTRKIKFKVYNPRLKQMSEPFTIEDLLSATIPLLHKSTYDEPLEWLQYTGLYDKQNKEGYENDIAVDLNEKKPIYWTIKWINNEGSFALTNSKYNPLVIRKLKEMTIIGNIYENPEYIKIEE